MVRTIFDHGLVTVICLFLTLIAAKYGLYSRKVGNWRDAVLMINLVAFYGLLTFFSLNDLLKATQQPLMTIMGLAMGTLFLVAGLSFWPTDGSEDQNPFKSGAILVTFMCFVLGLASYVGVIWINSVPL